MGGGQGQGTIPLESVGTDHQRPAIVRAFLHVLLSVLLSQQFLLRRRRGAFLSTFAPFYSSTPCDRRS